MKTRTTKIEDLEIGQEIRFDSRPALVTDIRRIQPNCYAIDIYGVGPEQTKYVRPGADVFVIVRKVRDWLPGDIKRLQCEYHDTRMWELLDREVLRTHQTWRDGHGWPGKHRNVPSWVEIEGGLAIGFNENPSRGWAFPVIKWPR